MLYEDWLAWADALIHIQWEQPLDWEFQEFRALWARELLEGGKLAGLSAYVRR